ncbi:MAG: HNH endonuclease signature motif containing protein [Stackebrandtia sp.]
MALRRHRHQHHPPVQGTHPPPTPRRHPHRLPPGGIVEIHVSHDLLTWLSADPTRASAWAGVVADIAAQHHARDQHRVDHDSRPDDRLPTAALRRHTEIRDRTCMFAGVCRRPAHASHQDHRHDHTDGGPTIADNLGPTCPPDHAVKHRAGWTVEPTWRASLLPDCGPHRVRPGKDMIIGEEIPEVQSGVPRAGGAAGGRWRPPDLRGGPRVRAG